MSYNLELAKALLQMKKELDLKTFEINDPILYLYENKFYEGIIVTLYGEEQSSQRWFLINTLSDSHGVFAHELTWKPFGFKFEELPKNTRLVWRQERHIKPLC